MKIEAQFNPSLVYNTQNHASTFKASFAAGPGKIIVKNKSIYDIQLTFADNETLYIESGMARYIQKELNNWIVTYTVLNASGLGTATSSGVPLAVVIPFQIVTVESYLISEQVVEQYPQSIPITYPASPELYAQAGSLWTTTTGWITNAAAGDFPFSLFNNSNVLGGINPWKMAIITSLQVGVSETGTGGRAVVYEILGTGNNPGTGFSNQTNQYIIGQGAPGGTNFMSTAYDTSSHTPGIAAGSFGPIATIPTTSGTLTELLTNGTVYVLPNTDLQGNITQTGIEVFVHQVAAGNWCVNCTFKAFDMPLNDVYKV